MFIPRLTHGKAFFQDFAGRPWNSIPMKNIIVLIAAALLPVQSFAAPTNAELKVGMAQEFENMNPLIMSMVATTWMYYIGNRALLTIDADGKWVPMLAKEIPSFQNKLAKFSADKKSMTALWEIKENAKWGDGTPVTCKDFQLAHEIGSSPNVATPEREVWTRVTKIEADPANPKKCTFTYDPARWDFYKMALFFPLPAHLEDEVFRKYKDANEGYARNTKYVTNPTLEGLYAGPYKVSEVKLGSHVVFVPNPQFYGEKPKIQKIIVKLIPNTGTLEANLRSGQIDKIADLGFTFDQALAFEKKIKAEKLPFEVQFKDSITFEYINMKLDNPILADVNVRHALTHAIDREQLVKALFEGRQKVAIHNISPIDPWYTADPKIVTTYPYNKKKAAELLDKAGWKLNASDGYRSKDGKKLSLQFMTTAGDKTRETVQTYLQSQWKAAGVEVIIKNEPARVFFGETLKKRKFEALTMSAWVSSPEENPKGVYHSKNIPTEANGWSGQNRVGWVNAKADKAMDDIDTEFDGTKRLKSIHEFLRQITLDSPVIPLYYRSDVCVIPKNLKNFRLSGHQFAETNEVEKWTLE